MAIVSHLDAIQRPVTVDSLVLLASSILTSTRQLSIACIIYLDIKRLLIRGDSKQHTVQK